jgi:hypothetical protein
MLKRKFNLLKELIIKASQRIDTGALSVIHCQKLAKYAHETYFRHLKLYNFVFQNNSKGQVNRIVIPQAMPSCGSPISEAMVLADKVTQIFYEPDEEHVQ